jgi:adenosylmethionine-8-amino-7-oxononanoate aminotransferase
MYELGCFDSPEDAEVSKWWRLNAGWGRVEIVEIIDKQQDEATESSIQN